MGWGGYSPSDAGKFAKSNYSRAENRPKVGKNFRKQLSFYRAAHLNFISPTPMIVNILSLQMQVPLSTKSLLQMPLA